MDRERPHTDPQDAADETEESSARGMAVSELTAREVGKPELADHEPAGPDPQESD
jgi:hypothetical protein